MLFKDVGLGLHVDEHARLYLSDFVFRARSTCNYISRKVAPLRYQAAGFWRLAVIGYQVREVVTGVRGESVLSVGVPFEQQRYDAIAGESLYEFFLEMLTEGLTVAKRNFDLPYKELMEAMSSYRSDSYRNEWLYKKKLFRGQSGLRGSLLCSMDTEKFTLRLRLERKGELLHESQILETEPDELCFAYQFKDLVIKDNKLVVTSRVSKPLVEFDLNSLLPS